MFMTPANRSRTRQKHKQKANTVRAVRRLGHVGKVGQREGAVIGRREQRK